MRNRRIVSSGPSRLSGGITQLTREPSGRRASASGDASSTRRPSGLRIRSITCSSASSDSNDARRRLDLARALHEHRSVPVDHDLVDRRDPPSAARAARAPWCAASSRSIERLALGLLERPCLFAQQLRDAPPQRLRVGPAAAARPLARRRSAAAAVPARDPRSRSSPERGGRHRGRAEPAHVPGGRGTTRTSRAKFCAAISVAA